MNTKRKKSRLRENIEVLVVAIILAMVIRTFVVQAFKIPTGSMLETLQIGDHILVNKFVYGIKMPFVRQTLISIGTPQREDIVVFVYPKDKNKDYIKRVIAVAGDELEIRDKQVYINREPVTHLAANFKDPGIIPRGNKNPPRDNYGPITIPENKLFVMGDNRDGSYDSRFWGLVDLSAVKGKAFIIYWSWEGKTLWKKLNGVRWDRLGTILK